MKPITATLIVMVAVSSAWSQAVFTEVVGKVEVLLPGQSQWQAAQVDMRIPEKTVIATGFESRAALRLGGSTVRLRPMSRLALEELIAAEGGQRTRLELRVGRISAEVRRGENRETEFSVRTPQATASVRGTDFEVGPYFLRTQEGVVEWITHAFTHSYPAGTEGTLDNLGLATASLDSLRYESLTADLQPMVSFRASPLGRGGKVTVTIE